MFACQYLGCTHHFPPHCFEPRGRKRVFLQVLLPDMAGLVQFIFSSEPSESQVQVSSQQQQDGLHLPWRHHNLPLTSCSKPCQQTDSQLGFFFPPRFPLIPNAKRNPKPWVLPIKEASESWMCLLTTGSHWGQKGMNQGGVPAVRGVASIAFVLPNVEHATPTTASHTYCTVPLFHWKPSVSVCVSLRYFCLCALCHTLHPNHTLNLKLVTQWQ